MKYVTLFSIICCFLLSINAQGQNQNDAIVGTWTFAQSESINKMEPEVQQSLSTDSGLQNHVATYYQGRSMTFDANGSFSISFSNGISYSGTWNLSSGILTTATNDGSSGTQQIIFVDENHLYLKSEEFQNPEAQLLFPELHFTKN